MHNVGNIIAICFFLLIKNGDSCKNNTNSFYGVNVSYSIPIFNMDGSFTTQKNSFEVYYSEDLAFYNFYYSFDSSENGKSLLKEKRNFYFIFHKDSSSGYNYYPYSHKPFSDGKLSVDSMLYLNTFINNKLDSLINFHSDSSFLEKNGDSVILYKIASSKELPEVFSIYLTYTKKIKPIDESFSKKMDTKKNMKLSKVKIVAHGAYYKEYSMTMPKREYVYEMIEIPKNKLEEKAKYLSMYKKEYLLQIGVN